MKRAHLGEDGTLVSMTDPDQKVVDIVDVTDEQYGLLLKRRAKYVKGQGIVMDREEEARIRHAAKRVMRRDYRHPNGAMESDLRATIHDTKRDRPLYGGSLGMVGTELLERLMIEAGVFDGDEFEVCVTATGRRPHGDRWFIKDGGQYRQETDEEILERIENNGNKTETGEV